MARAVHRFWVCGNIKSNMAYIPTIGLEIHAELKTKTKMFCDCLNDPEQKEPNVNVCPICMGHPGTLPVPNAEAIKKVIQAGAALHCEIAEFSKFDRKSYFYPDLPKGYQISQYDKPFCKGGYLDIGKSGSARSVDSLSEKSKEEKIIRITRIHLEEDAGGLSHPSGENYSLVDFNRAGVPLMELVTEPDIHSGEDARKFAEELQLILRYIGASDADMEKGEMRVEVNISIAPEGSKELGTKTEIKNLNSFRAVERCVAHEIGRQTEILERGEKMPQETRGWDDLKGVTFSQRAKEEAHDYRYFPEPDIPPIRLMKERPANEASGQGYFVIADIISSIPELPQSKRKRFAEEYGIDHALIEIFINDRVLAGYYEQIVSELLSWEETEGHKDEKEIVRQKLINLCANYITTDVRKILSDKGMAISDSKMSPEDFAEFVILIHTGKISSRGAKDLLPDMIVTGADPHHLVEERGLSQVSDAKDLEGAVEKVIKENSDAVEKYKAGKVGLLQFLVGQVMKETNGKANPQVVAEVLKRKIVEQ